MGRTSREARVLLALTLVSGGAAAGAACLDPTPVTVSAPGGSDAGVSPDVTLGDGGGDAEAAPPSACAVCMHTPDVPGPGCAFELTACQNNPKCAEAFACAFAKGCFNHGSTAGLIACGFPCAQEAGIITLTDPATDLAYNVFQCAGTSCAGPCGLAPDAGGD